MNEDQHIHGRILPTIHFGAPSRLNTFFLTDALFSETFWDSFVVEDTSPGSGPSRRITETADKRDKSKLRSSWGDPCDSNDHWPFIVPEAVFFCPTNAILVTLSGGVVEVAGAFTMPPRRSFKDLACFSAFSPKIPSDDLVSWTSGPDNRNQN